MDKPEKKRPSIDKLIPIAMIDTDDGIDYDWICDLINELRKNAGLEPLSHEELNADPGVD